MLTAETAEDARPAAAVKLHAPQQASPPTTATQFAQRMFVIAAASRGTCNGFARTKAEITLDYTVGSATVVYIFYV